jgi:hypothetical protein
VPGAAVRGAARAPAQRGPTVARRPERVDRVLALLWLLSALVVAGLARVEHPGPRRVPLYPTDAVVALLAVAAGLVNAPARRLARARLLERLGLALATGAYALWAALSTHPFEGPVLLQFPGGLGLGVHTGDLPVTAAIVVCGLVVDHRWYSRAAAERRRFRRLPPLHQQPDDL